jgi:ATP-dependent DNA helicase RecG
VTTRTELLELINNGENSGVEFKRDDIDNRALAKELVAFSNLSGGAVLLGVEDGGTVSGITRDKLEEWVMTACRDKIRPAIIPFFEIIRDVEPGKHVAVVRVAPGFSVHSVWHNSGNTYYIRVGTQSREATPEELSRLFQQRGAFRAELRPISGAQLADLDLRRLRDYFGRVRQQATPDEGDEAGWRTLLLNTELMVEEGITLSGLLLFGTSPNRFLPFAGIDAAAFPGIEKDYAARERATLRGPMTPLLGEGGLVENGLVEQALDFIRRNVAAKTTLEDGARRVDVPVYPPEVLRETLVNALIHRDYLLTSTDIELAIYSDRLEVISPGRLPNGITPARMRTGCRAARNQLIKDVMRDYGYLEHMGMGVPRKMVRGMKEHNGTDPELIEGEESFTVRLLAGVEKTEMAEKNEPIQEIAQQLWNFISSNNITATVAADENQIILNDPSNFHPPLKITCGGNGLFHLKDTQDGFQRQVYAEMARWNGDKSFTQSETLAEGEKWLTKLRRG